MLAFMCNSENYDPAGKDHLWNSQVQALIHRHLFQSRKYKHSTHDSLLQHLCRLLHYSDLFNIQACNLSRYPLSSCPSKHPTLSLLLVPSRSFHFYCLIWNVSVSFSPAIFALLPSTCPFSPLRSLYFSNSTCLFAELREYPGRPGLLFGFRRWRPRLLAGASWDRAGEGGSKAHMYTRKNKHVIVASFQLVCRGQNFGDG